MKTICPEQELVPVQVQVLPVQALRPLLASPEQVLQASEPLPASQGPSGSPQRV